MKLRGNVRERGDNQVQCPEHLERNPSKAWWKVSVKMWYKDGKAASWFTCPLYSLTPSVFLWGRAIWIVQVLYPRSQSLWVQMCVCLVVSERYCFPQLFTTSLSCNLSPLLPKRFQCIGNDLGLCVPPFVVVCTLHLIAAGKGIVGISLMMCQLVYPTPEQVPISRQTGLGGGRRKEYN